MIFDFCYYFNLIQTFKKVDYYNQSMTKDKVAHDSYRKLKYFSDNNISVHFKDNFGVFYNGEIISLDEKNLLMIFKERIKGTMPILLENIKSNSIFQFREEKI